MYQSQMPGGLDACSRHPGSPMGGDISLLAFCDYGQRSGTDGSSDARPIVSVGLDLDSLAERVRGLGKLVEVAVSREESRRDRDSEPGARERVSVIRAASPLRAPGSTAYVLVFANSSAHAVATPELGSLPFRGVAHPPASMNCR